MLIGAGEQRNGVYYLKFVVAGKTVAATNLRDGDLWHQRRLGHPSVGSLSSLSTNFGFKLNKSLDERCDVCDQAKQTGSLFPLVIQKHNVLFRLYTVIYGGHIILVALAVVVISYVSRMITAVLFGYSC